MQYKDIKTLTIVPCDDVAHINGEPHEIDGKLFPDNIHAIQWPRHPVAAPLEARGVQRRNAPKSSQFPRMLPGTDRDHARRSSHKSQPAPR